MYPYHDKAIHTRMAQERLAMQQLDRVRSFFFHLLFNLIHNIQSITDSSVRQQLENTNSGLNMLLGYTNRAPLSDRALQPRNLDAHHAVDNRLHPAIPPPPRGLPSSSHPPPTLPPSSFSSESSLPDNSHEPQPQSRSLVLGNGHTLI